MQVFRDDIKDAFRLTDNLEVARDNAEDMELEVSEDGNGNGNDLGDVEMDKKEDNEKLEDLDSVDGKGDDLWPGPNDGDLYGLVDGLGYGAL